MHKQTKTLIGCMILLGILLVGATFALTWEGVKEEPIVSESVELIKEDQNQVSQVKITTEQEEMTLKNQGEEAGFSVVGLENVPLSKSTINGTIETCTNLVANQQIKTEETVDLAIYGLASPAIKVEVEMKEGQVYTLEVGDEAPSSQGYYTLFENQVYLISTSDAMNLKRTLYDFIDTQIVSSKASDVQIEELILNNTGSPEIQLTYVPEETVTKEKTSEQVENTNTASKDTEENEEISEETEIIPAYYTMTQPYTKDLTTYDVTSWTDGVFGMYASAIEAIDVTEAQIQQYGFHDPLSVLEIKLTDGQYIKLMVTRQNDAYYMMKEGTPIIYQVNESDLGWLHMTPVILTRNVFENRTSKEIESIDVTTEQEAFHLVPDGEELTREELEQVGNMIFAFTPTQVETVESFSLQKVATITLRYQDGTMDQLELIPTGSGTLYMVLNGECEYTTSEWSLTSLLEKCNSVYEEIEEEK